MPVRVMYGPHLVHWAEERIEGAAFRPDAVAVGAWRGNRIIGVFVYDTFSASNCFMHVASDGSRRWLTRGVLMHVFAYPFLQCEFRRVTATVDERNAESLRFVRKLGGVEEGRLRQGAPDGGADMIVFGMLRSECRWVQPDLKLEAGQPHPIAV